MSKKLTKEMAELFRKHLEQAMPWLELGKVDFVGRVVYDDFHYTGRFKFPVTATPDLSLLVDGTYKKKERLKDMKRIYKRSTLSTLNYQGRVTFHELGHAIVLVLHGKNERLKLPNYGFSTENPTTRKGWRAALTNEIETFAVQHRLHHELGFTADKFPEASVHQMTKLIRKFPKWVGWMSNKEMKEIYEKMYDFVSPAMINYALRKMNEMIE